MILILELNLIFRCVYERVAVAAIICVAIIAGDFVLIINTYTGDGLGSKLITVLAGDIKIEISVYPIKNCADNYLYIIGSDGESVTQNWNSNSAVERNYDSL